MSPEQRRQAQLRVAERAGSAQECTMLLSMLGLLDEPETDSRTSGLVCQTCARPMMPNGTPGALPEGWIRQKAGNQCVPCYQRSRQALAAQALSVPEHRVGILPEPVQPDLWNTAPQELSEVLTSMLPTSESSERPVRARKRSTCRAKDLGFQERVARLRAEQGQTWEEIGTELGCTPRTARSAYAQVVTL